MRSHRWQALSANSPYPGGEVYGPGLGPGATGMTDRRHRLFIRNPVAFWRPAHTSLDQGHGSRQPGFDLRHV